MTPSDTRRSLSRSRPSCVCSRKSDDEVAAMLLVRVFIALSR